VQPKQDQVYAVSIATKYDITFVDDPRTGKRFKAFWVINELKCGERQF